MNPTPPSELSRIPLRTLKAAQVARLERHYYQLLRTLDRMRKTTPEVTAEYDRANACWHALWQESKRRLLVAAQREEVLWTVFVPHSYGTEEVIRTKRHTITHWWHNEYPLLSPWYKKRGAGRAEKAYSWDEPWTDLRKLLAKQETSLLPCAA